MENDINEVSVTWKDVVASNKEKTQGLLGQLANKEKEGTEELKAIDIMLRELVQSEDLRDFLKARGRNLSVIKNDDYELDISSNGTILLNSIGSEGNANRDEFVLTESPKWNPSNPKFYQTDGKEFFTSSPSVFYGRDELSLGDLLSEIIKDQSSDEIKKTIARNLASMA